MFLIEIVVESFCLSLLIKSFFVEFVIIIFFKFCLKCFGFNMFFEIIEKISLLIIIGLKILVMFKLSVNFLKFVV